MKRILSLILTISLVLSLCACGASPAPAKPEQVPSPTPETTEVPLSPVTELPLSEYYYARAEENSLLFSLSLTLYPSASYCTITTFRGNTALTLFSGSYTEEDGLITLEDSSLQLRREDDGLIIQSGSLTAQCTGIRNEEGSFDDYEGPETREFGQGSLISFSGSTQIHGGIYELDTSQQDYDFGEVLLSLDLTQMTFALKCYDGNVIQGTLEFTEDLLVCRYDGGCIAFTGYSIAEGDFLTQASLETEIREPLLIYPDMDNRFYVKFRLAPHRQDVIVPDPAVQPIDQYKELAVEWYNVSYPEAEGELYSCHLSVQHYPHSGTWSFSVNSTAIPLEAQENPDGTIVLSKDGETWNFHREGSCLVFDGGSPLVAKNIEVSGPQYSREVLPGTLLTPAGFSYFYDTTYAIPGTDGSNLATLRFDREHQRLVIGCFDGSTIECPYVYKDHYIYALLGNTALHLSFSGHRLTTSNPWEVTIAPPSGKTGGLMYFIPVLDTVDLQESLRFKVTYPQVEEAPENSISVYDDHTVLSARSGHLYSASLVLIPHDGTFQFNNEYCCYYCQGTYREEDGYVILNHREGTTTLRREGGNLVVESGAPLYLVGQPFTNDEDRDQELPAGTRLPLYQPGDLYSGTYTFTSSEGTASVTFDTENRTFTLTDAAGTEYEGSFHLDFKFVVCDGGSRQFQFIPYGDQVRLNQSQGDKVVPVEDNFIFFDYAP